MSAPTIPAPEFRRIPAARLIAYRAPRVAVDILDVPAILAGLTWAEVAELEESFCTVTGHYAMMYPQISGHVGQVAAA